MNNQKRVLNEWYQLFQNNHHILSDVAYKHWECVLTYGFKNFKNYCRKYSIFQEFLKHHFVFNKKTILDTVCTYTTSKLCVDSHMLVFINGRFSSELSDKLIDPWIIRFDNSPKRYNVSKPIYPDMFVYLTECLSYSMVCITLPHNKIPEKPLYLLYITEGSNESDQLVTSHYFHHLKIGQNTEAYVIEHFVSINNGAHFNGVRMLISVGSRSKLSHTKLIFENKNSYHIAHQDIHSEQSANISSDTFIIGPRFTYNQVNSQINHSQVLLSLNSLMLLSNQKFGNIATYVEHNNTNYSLSKQIHKIIANDYSTGMFDGLIKVHKNSIKTDAHMINNNLLLNQHASIYSVPKLEIYSDAIKCSHGSTTGQINANHLFYLNTRGITKENAFKILISAFTEEIIKKIRLSSLRDFVITTLNQNLIRRI